MMVSGNYQLDRSGTPWEMGLWALLGIVPINWCVKIPSWTVLNRESELRSSVHAFIALYFLTVAVMGQVKHWCCPSCSAVMDCPLHCEPRASLLSCSCRGVFITATGKEVKEPLGPQGFLQIGQETQHEENNEAFIVFVPDLPQLNCALR